MARLRVVVQPGTGYELLLSATAIADVSSQQRIDSSRGLRKRARAIDKGRVVKSLGQIGREPFLNLLGFIHAMTDEPTAANAIKAITDAPAEELVLGALGYNRRAFRIPTSQQIVRAAVIDRDAAAIRDFKRTSYPHLTNWQATLRHMLSMKVDDAAAEIVGTLTRWHEAGFSELEPDLAEEDSRGVERVRQLVATRDLDAVLAEVAPAIVFTREVGQEVVVLTPSTIVRPAWALADYGPTLVIAYPAPLDDSGVEDPSARLVLLAKALGDELRMRALRELRDGPMTATELARRLGIPRTTIHHHLQILTNAGLVRMPVDDARWSTVELRPEGAAELARLASSLFSEPG
jgi:DNA-binding transcriptional ArsR family regulator